MAYLVLANGTVFRGERIGAPINRTGELVFDTGVVGYLETLTDPGYYGQILVQSFPSVGNYGVIEEDFEGKSALFGYIVRDLCGTPSNFRSGGALNGYLEKNGIPGLMGLDTRHIVRILREEGTMNAMITDTVPDDLTELRNYAVKDAVRQVTAGQARVFPSQGEMLHRVTVLDLGVRKCVVEGLRRRHCEVTVVPADTDADKILKGSPDGVLLSNGPGAPDDNALIVAEVAKLLGKVPLMGIGLGHQLAALALGGRTVRLKYGHHGGNYPVRDELNGKTCITHQNTCYAVEAGSVAGKAQQAFTNINDGTPEGLFEPGLGLLTVQFLPDSEPAPRDTGYVYDTWLDMMGGGDNVQR